eukprot:1203294-Pleurochrysis_carterae.AAC.5
MKGGARQPATANGGERGQASVYLANTVANTVEEGEKGVRRAREESWKAEGEQESKKDCTSAVYKKVEAREINERQPEKASDIGRKVRKRVGTENAAQAS